MYQVIALRYRPRRFSEVVGQEETARTLKQAIENGVDGFIVKPYTQKKVGEMLEKYRRRVSVGDVG